MWFDSVSALHWAFGKCVWKAGTQALPKSGLMWISSVGGLLWSGVVESVQDFWNLSQSVAGFQTRVFLLWLGG